MLKTVKNYILVAVVFASIVLSAASCASSASSRFKETSYAFSEDMRWMRVEPAKTYFDPKLLQEIGPALDIVGKEFMITGAEILNIVMDENEEGALVTVRFNWYVLPDVNLRTTDEVQVWKKIKDRWFLTESKGTLFTEIKKAFDKKEAGEEKDKTIPKVYEPKPDI